LISLGNIKLFLDDQESARKLFNQSPELSESLNDAWRKANAYYYLGWDHSDFQRMFANWDKAIQLYSEVGDQIALANLLGVIGQFRVTHGEFELGEKYLDEALQLWQANI